MENYKQLQCNPLTKYKGVDEVLGQSRDVRDFVKFKCPRELLLTTVPYFWQEYRCERFLFVSADKEQELVNCFNVFLREKEERQKRKLGQRDREVKAIQKTAEKERLDQLERSKAAVFNPVEEFEKEDDRLTDEMIVRYCMGESVEILACELGIHSGTFYRRLKMQNIPTRLKTKHCH